MTERLSEQAAAEDMLSSDAICGDSAVSADVDVILE